MLVDLINDVLESILKTTRLRIGDTISYTDAEAVLSDMFQKAADSTAA